MVIPARCSGRSSRRSRYCCLWATQCVSYCCRTLLWRSTILGRDDSSSGSRSDAYSPQTPDGREPYTSHPLLSHARSEASSTCSIFADGERTWCRSCCAIFPCKPASRNNAMCSVTHGGGFLENKEGVHPPLQTGCASIDRERCDCFLRS